LLSFAASLPSAKDALLLILLFGSEPNTAQGVKRKMQVKITAKKAIRQLFLKNTRGIITHNCMAYPDTEILNKPQFDIFEKQRRV
jgi:1,2-phenylacetyl-CoA epoxidase catalytic subunit